MEMKFTTANFEEEVLKSEIRYWLIFMQIGAVLARKYLRS